MGDGEQSSLKADVLSPGGWELLVSDAHITSELLCNGGSDSSASSEFIPTTLSVAKFQSMCREEEYH